MKVNFQKVFPNSIKSAKVGFMSPDPNAMKDPSYRQVCSGITGHVEVLNVELTDPTPEIFEELLKFFFQFHDPTTLNSQGNDKGTQYASYIFTTDDKQKEIAEKVIKNLQALLDNKQITAFAKDSVTTKVADATEFYVAHAEHQEYLAKNPNGKIDVSRTQCMSRLSLTQTSSLFFNVSTARILQSLRSLS